MSRLALAAVGAAYALTGVAMLAVPTWFFETIGTFPPFNRHYLGDLGAFTLAVGLGLLVGARYTAYARGTLLVALIASAAHLANHVYDAAVGTLPARGWSDVPPLAVLLLILAVPAWRRQPGM